MENKQASSERACLTAVSSRFGQAMALRLILRVHASDSAGVVSIVLDSVPRVSSSAECLDFHDQFVFLYIHVERFLSFFHSKLYYIIYFHTNEVVVKFELKREKENDSQLVFLSVFRCQRKIKDRTIDKDRLINEKRDCSRSEC